MILHPEFLFFFGTFGWVSAAAAVAGAGASIYGANKQSKANAKAQDQQNQAVADQNRLNWINYLATRGISPADPASVQPGQMPTRYNVVNTKLPVWATIRTPAGGSFSAPTPAGRATTAPVKYVRIK